MTPADETGTAPAAVLPAVLPAGSARDVAAATADAELMARYGIVRRPVDYFHVGPHRYTSLEDAVAEAKRSMARD